MGIIKWIVIILTLGAGALAVSCGPANQLYICDCNTMCDLESVDTNTYDICAPSKESAESRSREGCEISIGYPCSGSSYCHCTCYPFEDGEDC